MRAATASRSANIAPSSRLRPIRRLADPSTVGHLPLFCVVDRTAGDVHSLPGGTMRVRSVRFRLLDSLRAVGLVLLAGATLLCPACGQGNRLKPYTVRGQVFFEGKPAA